MINEKGKICKHDSVEMPVLVTEFQKSTKLWQINLPHETGQLEKAKIKKFIFFHMKTLKPLCQSSVTP